MKTDYSKESRELDCGTLWKITDEIALMRFKDGVDLCLEDAKAVSEAAINLFQGKKFLAIIDVRNMGGSVAKEASKFFATNEEIAKYRLAQAIVVNTLAMKLVARFYIKIDKPLREAQVFDDIEEAMDWLQTKRYLLD